jgi:hypothetical protein
MQRFVAAAAKFIMAFFLMTIICMVSWDMLVNTKLYN